MMMMNKYLVGRMSKRKDRGSQHSGKKLVWLIMKRKESTAVFAMDEEEYSYFKGKEWWAKLKIRYEQRQKVWLSPSGKVATSQRT